MSFQTISSLQSQRYAILDILRGIAVLGILLLNIYSMGVMDFAYVNFSPVLNTDIALETVSAFLFEGRFRSLFCLLFGVGLYLQISKQLSLEQPHLKLIKSRLKWLLFFGVIHCSLIWSGDILMMYALCGLLIYKKLTLPADQLWQKGLFYTSTGLAIMLAQGLLSLFMTEPVSRDSALFIEAYEFWTSGLFEPIIIQLYYTVMVLVFFPLFAFYFAGLMLLGAAAYKDRVFSNGLSPQQVRQLLFYTILVSAVDVIVRRYLPFKSDILAFPFASLSGVLMAFLIIHWVVKYQAKFNALLRYFANVGRLAFSLYILQSLVMVLFFRYWQPQLLLAFTRLDYLLLTIAAGVVQLLMAHYYFKFFAVGPLEKLWRYLIKKNQKITS
ncbi:MAG: DUF418 domain-containing protein [Thalassotalea sp.]